MFELEYLIRQTELDYRSNRLEVADALSVCSTSTTSNHRDDDSQHFCYRQTLQQQDASTHQAQGEHTIEHGIERFQAQAQVSAGHSSQSSSSSCSIAGPASPGGGEQNWPLTKGWEVGVGVRA